MLDLHVKSQRTHGTHHPIAFIVKMQKMIKIYLRITSEPYAYLPTMFKTSIEFPKNQCKTVGVTVAHKAHTAIKGWKARARGYKTFFMLSSAELEI